MSRKQKIESLLAELAPLTAAGYFVGLHIRFAAPLMTFQTYSKEWSDHYTRNAYALRDPMIAWGISRTGATRWSDIDLPDPFDIMKDASRHGLVYGACISCGEISSRTVAGVSRPDREFTEAEILEVRDIIFRLHTISQPGDTLTKIEIEALQILASGKRYSHAAAALGISESALNARLASARRKLFVRSSAEAIQHAKDYQLI